MQILIITTITAIILMMRRCWNAVAFKCFNHHCTDKWTHSTAPLQPLVLFMHAAVVVQHLAQKPKPRLHSHCTLHQRNILQLLNIYISAQPLDASHKTSVTNRCSNSIKYKVLGSRSVVAPNAATRAAGQMVAVTHVYNRRRWCNTQIRTKV